LPVAFAAAPGLTGVGAKALFCRSCTARNYMESVTVLIVEDEAILRMDLTYRLTQMGYRVVDSVDNGPDALQAYETQPVDLVLLDIHILGE